MYRVAVSRVGLGSRHSLQRAIRRWQSTSPGEQKPDEQSSILDRLRGWTSLRQEQVGGFVSSANSNFAQWGALLNKMSGYEEIHDLKETVVQNGAYERRDTGPALR